MRWQTTTGFARILRGFSAMQHRRCADQVEQKRAQLGISPSTGLVVCEHLLRNDAERERHLAKPPDVKHCVRNAVQLERNVGSAYVGHHLSS